VAGDLSPIRPPATGDTLIADKPSILRLARGSPPRHERAAELDLNGAVDFTEPTLDVPSSLRACDVAPMPSDGCVKSFWGWQRPI
jgi:hypothetical protein